MFCIYYEQKRWFQLLVKKLDVICLTPKNRLILILCCWLLKKTWVIATNLTNSESAPDLAFRYMLFVENIFFN